MLILLWPNNPTRAQTASFLRFVDHSQTHHTRYNSSGRGIGPTLRTLHDSTQQTQETNIHNHGGIYNTTNVINIVFIMRHANRNFFRCYYVRCPV